MPIQPQLNDTAAKAGPGRAWPADSRSLPGPEPAALARTKLLPPRLPPHVLALPRQLDLVDALLRHSVCLVRAPSGYGKSTLCARWHRTLADRRIDAAWVSFERDDDDLGRAVSYVMAAVRQALAGHPGYDAVADALAFSDTMVVLPQPIAIRFINAIHDLGRPFVLFLDDVDRLTDPRTLQFLNYILLHCPDNLHLILACQKQLALPLVYLDHHGLLLRVGVEQMRLTDAEAQQLLADAGMKLSDDEIRRLNAAMAGWVTGLRIGSAALRNNRDALFDIGLVSHGARWLSDYLDDNILQHLTADVRSFLMKCAIVDTMNADLCSTLSGTADAAPLLDWLADQNLFVQRVDDAGTWFRIHGLFREFLLAKLDSEQPAEIVRLHGIASRWFAAQNRPAEAIGHALDAGDAESAAALISLSAMGMVERSDILTLLGWIARLPDAAIADRLPLRLAQAWSLTLSLRPQARALLDDLAGQAMKMGNTLRRRAFERELAGIETVFVAVYEDRLDAAREHGLSFLQTPGEEDSFLSRAVRNATAYCEIGLGNHRLVHDLVRPALLHAARSEQIFPTAYRYCIIGLSYRAQGQLAEAERTFRAGLALAEQVSGPESASSALVSPFVARSHYERDDLAGAAAVLAGRLPTIDDACFNESVINAYFVSVRTAAARGDRTTAAALIEHAELLGHERGWKRLLASCMVDRAHLGLPQTMEADRLVRSSDEADAVAAPLSLDARTFAILAKLRVVEALDADDPGRVAEICGRLGQLGTLTDSIELRTRSNFLAMLAGLAIGCAPPPQSAIDQVAGALKAGFRRTLIDVIETISSGNRRIDEAHASWPIELRSLIRDTLRIDLVQRISPGGAMAAPTVFSILTSREIDVLTGVSCGESNKDIARQLHLTPETVKWHLKNVMRKLGADSRAEAVRKAAGLGLSLAPD